VKKKKRRQLLNAGIAKHTAAKPIYRLAERIYRSSEDLINQTWWKHGLTDPDAFHKHRTTLELISGLALTPAEGIDFDGSRFICIFQGIDFPDKRILVEFWILSGRSRLTIYLEESQQVIKSASCSYVFVNRAFQWLNERKISEEAAKKEAAKIARRIKKSATVKERKADG
jgi:hypothetical protein